MDFDLWGNFKQPESGRYVHKEYQARHTSWSGCRQCAERGLEMGGLGKAHGETVVYARSWQLKRHFRKGGMIQSNTFLVKSGNLELAALGQIQPTDVFCLASITFLKNFLISCQYFKIEISHKILDLAASLEKHQKMLMLVHLPTYNKSWPLALGRACGSPGSPSSTCAHLVVICDLWAPRAGPLGDFWLKASVWWAGMYLTTDALWES